MGHVPLCGKRKGGRQYLKIESVIRKRWWPMSRGLRDFFLAFLSYSSLLSLCALLGALTDTGKEWCCVESRLVELGVGGGPDPWVFALPASQCCMTWAESILAESLMGLIIPFFQSHRVKVSFKAAVNWPAHRRSACIPQPRLLSTFTIVCQALGHKLGNSHEQKRAAPCSGAARSRKGSAGLWAPRGRCGPPGRAAAVALAPGHSWPLQDCFQGQSVLAHCED